MDISLGNEQLTRAQRIYVKGPAIPGDLDGNDIVDRDDVIQLLLHITMPEMFGLDAPADFNNDGLVTRDDVIALLLHISMPDIFPL